MQTSKKELENKPELQTIETLIIKGIELGLFGYTDGKGIVHKLTNSAQIKKMIAGKITETMLQNYIMYLEYIVSINGKKYCCFFLEFTNSKIESNRKLCKRNETFLRCGIVTATNQNQTKMFAVPFSIEQYNVILKS